jgi:hypothetical protein
MGSLAMTSIDLCAFKYRLLLEAKLEAERPGYVTYKCSCCL